MKRCLAFLTLLLVSAACASPTPSPTSTPPPTPTFWCPEATPEALRVDPLLAATTDLSITVRVSLGNMEEITVETESGTFTSSTSEVVVTLLPNTIHHLRVVGKVSLVEGFGCQYGGYELSTSFDTDGNPLVIEQESP